MYDRERWNINEDLSDDNLHGIIEIGGTKWQ